MASVRTIGLSLPWLDEREEELVGEVLRSGRLSLGPTIDRFEEEFAATVGAPFAAAVSSGTAGLHLLCITAGVGPGDEVVTSPYSFVASANCAIYEGATPVFADIDRETLNLTPSAVEAAITDRTRAVIAVDIYGYPCELDELRALCDAPWSRADRGCLRGARRPLQGSGDRVAGTACRLRLLPEQADHDGRGRDGHHALRARMAPPAEPAQPGSRRLRGLARARKAGVQLSARRHSRRDRARTAREARRDPRGQSSCRRALQRSFSDPSPGSSCHARTTPTTSARGSSTSSGSRRAPTVKP